MTGTPGRAGELRERVMRVFLDPSALSWGEPGSVAKVDRFALVVGHVVLASFLAEWFTGVGTRVPASRRLRRREALR